MIGQVRWPICCVRMASAMVSRNWGGLGQSRPPATKQGIYVSQTKLKPRYTYPNLEKCLERLSRSLISTVRRKNSISKYFLTAIPYRRYVLMATHSVTVTINSEPTSHSLLTSAGRTRVHDKLCPSLHWPSCYYCHKISRRLDHVHRKSEMTWSVMFSLCVNNSLSSSRRSIFISTLLTTTDLPWSWVHLLTVE